jgi:hypothetical protein
MIWSATLRCSAKPISPTRACRQISQIVSAARWSACSVSRPTSRSLASLATILLAIGAYLFSKPSQALGKWTRCARRDPYLRSSGSDPSLLRMS